MEEFSYGQVGDPGTRHLIKSGFMDVWDSRMPQVSLQNICDDLCCHYPDENIGKLM